MVGLLMNRTLLFAAFCILAIFLTVRQYHENLRETIVDTVSRAHTAGSKYAGSTASSLSPDRPLKIVFTELQAAHDEVVAPLLQAFANLPGANITAMFFRRLNRFGAFDMYSKLNVPITLPQPRKDEEIFPYVYNEAPDILVAVSCGYDDFEKYQRLLKETNVHIFCVVHHSDKWADWMFQFYEKRLGAWVSADRMDFVALSQHVSNSLADALLAWKEVKIEGHYPHIRTFPPVFGIARNTSQDENSSHIDFALQGNYQPERRNFTRVFQELSLAKYRIASGDDGVDKDTTLTLHLVGSGSPKPQVPNEIKDMVVFQEDLDYGEFYNVLARMTAILPAFADPDYYVHKASSSIPASIISGTPLVATRKLLDTYSYLQEDAVWLQKDSQSEFDVLWEVVKKPAAERAAKLKAAGLAAEEIVLQNKLNVVHWVEKALALHDQRLAVSAA